MAADIISRHRPLALLAAAVLAQIMILAYQIKREHNVRLIRYWAAEVFTPPGRAGTWGLSKVGSVWHGYFALHHASVENDELRAELGNLQLRNRELESEAAEGQRLATLLNFHNEHPETPLLAAQVIDASADPASRTLFINRGERDHIRRNMGVITPAGVIGKIVETYPTKSEVLLINDKDSGVGALLADTRTHGVVKGSTDSGPRLDYVVNDEKVHPGEIVVTSGEDRIFPKDLLIGTVTEFRPGTPFQVIRLETAARLDRLEDVLVLLTQQEIAPKTTSDGAAAAQVSADGMVQSEPAPATSFPVSPASPTSATNASKPTAAAATSVNTVTPAAPNPAATNRTQPQAAKGPAASAARQ